MDEQIIAPEELREQEIKKHISDCKAVDDSYLHTLIISGAVILGAIAVAVFYRVSIGIALAVLGVVIYSIAASNTLYNKLGLAYRSSTGKMTVTEAYGRRRSTVFIPERIMMLDVCEISDRAFDHKSSETVSTVYLPATLTRIGKDVFRGCPELREIHYAGSASQWELIESDTDLGDITVIFSSGVSYPKKPKRTRKAKKEECK